MAKEKPPKADKKQAKEEKKEEKKRKRELKKTKSRESLASESGMTTPKTKRKDLNKSSTSSPGRDSQTSSSKKKGIFKRIGSFMLPAPALAPASPPAQQRLNVSQSCQDLGSGRGLSPSPRGLNVGSSSPNLLSVSPPTSPPPPIPGQGRSVRAHPTPTVSRHFPASFKTRPSFDYSTYSTEDNGLYLESDYRSLMIPARGDVIDRGYDVTNVMEDGEVSCVMEELDSDEGQWVENLTVQELNIQQVHRNPMQMFNMSSELMNSEGNLSVEYSIPVKEKPNQSILISSDDDETEGISPRRSSIKTTSPSPRREKRISFAADDDVEFRVVTPEILKRDLAATLGVPVRPADTARDSDVIGDPDDVISLPEPADFEHLPPEEKCAEQAKLLRIYEDKILQFRDQVLEIVADNRRLKRSLSENNAQDIATIQKQAQQVLQENRILIKEHQMNEARWQELIQERNEEVLRIRSTCTNMEEQNKTLVKRTDKLEARNEDLREAYNSIVTQADDFVPVTAHLSSMEGYKAALEELRRRYDDNIADKDDEIHGLDKNVSQLTEKVEVMEEERSLLAGQVKGLKEALERAQHSSTRHKREVTQLTLRVNTLKTSLSQAINIAEQSTLHKLELAEISELQSKQMRSGEILHTDNKVREVKRIANAKLKSCAEIIQEREIEHERDIGRLNDRISKLKLRCANKDEIIKSFTSSDRTPSPEST